MGEDRAGASTGSDDVGSRSKPRRLLETLEDRRRRFQQRGVVFRGLFLVLGILVVLAGGALIVLPGPALVVIPIGLAMLALQFDWAERLLERAVDQAERASEAAAAASPAQRLLTGALVVLGLAGVGVWAYLGDVPLVPFL